MVCPVPFHDVSMLSHSVELHAVIQVLFALCSSIVDSACLLLFMHFSFYLVFIVTLFHLVVIFPSVDPWFAVFKNTPASICMGNQCTDK